MRSQCISRPRLTSSLPTTGMLFSAWQATTHALHPTQRRSGRSSCPTAYSRRRGCGLVPAATAWWTTCAPWLREVGVIAEVVDWCRTRGADERPVLDAAAADARARHRSCGDPASSRAGTVPPDRLDAPRRGRRTCHRARPKRRRRCVGRRPQRCGRSNRRRRRRGGRATQRMLSMRAAGQDDRRGRTELPPDTDPSPCRRRRRRGARAASGPTSDRRCPM